MSEEEVRLGMVGLVLAVLAWAVSIWWLLATQGR
jgi:hypothetical protein